MKQYFRHKIENLLVVSKIITVHYFEFGKNFMTTGESHNFWELVYADKSDVDCIADNKRVTLREGEMLFHKPNEFHAIAANGKNAPNVLIISFECKSEAMSFYEDRKISPSRRNLQFLYAILEEAKKTFDIPFSDPNAKKIELLPSPTLGGQQLIKNYLEIFLIDVMRSMTETESGNKTFLKDRAFDKKPVANVVKVLSENVFLPLSIDQICKKTNYSRSYLFREFKAETGKSIIQYFIDLKIEKAKELLRENDLSIKEISEKLAFDTPNYFSKTFRKLTAFTPTAYRKRNN